MRYNHHTKLGLICVKEGKVTGGGGIPPPQVNVLDRLGEIRLSHLDEACKK